MRYRIERMDRWRMHHLLLVSALCAACLFCACGRKGAGGESPEASLPPYPPSLSAASTPSQVATVLVQALDARDKQTLLGLVAAKHEADQVDRIYRRHGRSHETAPEKAAAMAVAGWLLSYEWFEEGSTRVTGERVTGDSATVQAQGRNPNTDQARLLTVELVREDGVWKVAGGLRSREL
jgi:hypothetical protein